MAGSVFLFVPNIIGYIRVVLCLVSLYYMPSDPLKTVVLYITSAGLDAVDGYAARYFHQESQFGAVLDMVTDRCGITVMNMGLAVLYPQYAILFQLYVFVDIGSHWAHTANSVGKGSHHKEQNHNFLLRLYYTNRLVLFFVCSVNECFFVLLYMLNWTKGPQVYAGFGVVELLALFCIPVVTFKTIVSVIQGRTAFVEIGKRDMEIRASRNNNHKKDGVVTSLRKLAKGSKSH